MKYFIVFLLALAGLTSCALNQTISREEMAANLGPMKKVEEQLEKIKNLAGILKSANAVSEETNSKLVMHHDIYFAHYVAANNALAHGNLKDYMFRLKDAEKELNAMSEILKEVAKANIRKLRALGWPL